MRNGSRPLRLTASVSASLCVAAAAMLLAPPASASPDDVETLVFVRHGEKPPEGLGQLNCQGLNRALALPAVIAAKFGKPDAIYAPDPGEKKTDHGHAWYYVRPLATVEPTAIQFGLPVQTPYGYSRSASLAQTLVAPEWRGRTALIAWEHHDIVQMVRQIVAAHGGNAAAVPSWPGHDFDSLYVVRIDWSGDQPRATFTHDHEGLDGRSTDCPCAALPGGK